MKALAYIFIIVSFFTLALSLFTKFSPMGFIGGITPSGYLIATTLLLLFAANIALLELLGKK